MKKIKSHQSNFPSEDILGPIRKKLSDPNYEGGNLALPPNASEIDRAKYQICQMIARYKREHSLLQRDIAKQLEIDESRISDILRGKIDSFTLDRLLSYVEKLHPNYKINITAA